MDVKKRRVGTAFIPCLLFLALCFLFGIILGQVMAGRLSSKTASELKEYLSDFLLLKEDSFSGTVLSALLLYFRYPLLAAFLGFASIGIVFLPVLSGVFGFFLSFSMGCFVSTFGYEGVILAAAVFGLRCAVTIPCYFLLAVPSFETSAALAGLLLGKGRRTLPVVYGRSWWFRWLIVTGILSAGVCIDVMLSHHLAYWVLGYLF